MMRSASNAQAYASACREVYEELKDRLDIRLCDLWAKMMSCCGWNGTGTLVGDRDAPKSDELSELLRDGM